LLGQVSDVPAGTFHQRVASPTKSVESRKKFGCEGSIQHRKIVEAIDVPIIVVTIIVRVTFDPAKRAATFDERGLDFEDALEVFSGFTAELEDTREDYGETRIICYGNLRGRMVQIVYTTRDTGRHIISMRKANAREKARFSAQIGL
jgi:uncharacterized protein